MPLISVGDVLELPGGERWECVSAKGPIRLVSPRGASFWRTREQIQRLMWDRGAIVWHKPSEASRA